MHKSPDSLSLVLNLHHSHWDLLGHAGRLPVQELRSKTCVGHGAFVTCYIVLNATNGLEISFKFR